MPDDAETLTSADKTIDDMVACMASNNSDYAESADSGLARILDEVDAASVNDVTSECSSNSIPELASLLTDEFILNEVNWEKALFGIESMDTQLVDLSCINPTGPFSDSEDEPVVDIVTIEIDSDETNIDSDENFADDKCQVIPTTSTNLSSQSVIEIDSDSLPDLTLLGSRDEFQRIIKTTEQKADTHGDIINLDSSRSIDSTDEDIENLVDNREVDDGFDLKQDIHRKLMADQFDKELKVLKR